MNLCIVEHHLNDHLKSILFDRALFVDLDYLDSIEKHYEVELKHDK
jgi:hypothetical protein